ncbi:MAG TPA: hypothetical protein HA252_03550 [Candidatus Diapherotrites archaeon]|uniref:Uncharacterized protein n=2 Tax=Candidatus Iainarchaeum sp. TaxID=3101447 RepID=A0A7J4JFA8_9ARCH|nr:hypothetical protein [Candidatus Diapherotrites archaeon]
MMDSKKLLVVAGLGVVLGALLSLVALNFYGNNLVVSGMVSPYSRGMTPEMTKMMAGMMGSGAGSGMGEGMGSMMQGMMGSGAKGMNLEAVKKMDFSTALEEAKKAGLTEAQLKEKGEALMEAMMGKEMHEEMEQTTPQAMHELMELRMGLMTSGYVGMGMGSGSGMCPMCAAMMGKGGMGAGMDSMTGGNKMDSGMAAAPAKEDTTQ